MTEPVSQTAMQHERPPFQFALSTLLSVFVVLASSLAVFGTGGLIVFALIAGLAAFVYKVASLSSLGAIGLIVLCSTCVLLPAVRIPPIEVRDSGRRSVCGNNLKQIAFAVQQYHAAHGRFPPAYVADKAGKPMYSWRVLILPYIEETSLYKSFNLNEPWDGPNNKKLAAIRQPVFECPSDYVSNKSSVARTNYVAIVGQEAARAGEKPQTIVPPYFPEGSHKTIMLVEVTGSGIAWSEPRDLSLSALDVAADKTPALTVSSKHGWEDNFFYTHHRSAGASAVLADGHILFLPYERLSLKNLRKELQVDGFDEDDDPSAPLIDSDAQLNWPNIAALVVWLLSVGIVLTMAVRRRKT